LQKIINADYKIPDNVISSEAESLLKSMLVVDGAKRPTCKKISRHPWMQIDQMDSPTLNKYRILIDKSLDLFVGSSPRDICTVMCTCLEHLGVLTIFNPNFQPPSTPENRRPVKCHYPEKQIKFSFTYYEREDEPIVSFKLEEGDCGPFRALKPLLLKEI